ncbi:hypothetical protein WG899_11710 [Paucibacter sp. AS339]|uniref:hypothetical protein n=1 Tax=Paucibacter hankyongi TaxID=3133434 RepID=UPI0030A9B755
MLADSRGASSAAGACATATETTDTSGGAIDGISTGKGAVGLGASDGDGNGGFGAAGVAMMLNLIGSEIFFFTEPGSSKVQASSACKPKIAAITPMREREARSPGWRAGIKRGDAFCVVPGDRDDFFGSAPRSRVAAMAVVTANIRQTERAEVPTSDTGSRSNGEFPLILTLMRIITIYTFAMNLCA